VTTQKRRNADAGNIGAPDKDVGSSSTNHDTPPAEAARIIPSPDDVVVDLDPEARATVRRVQALHGVGRAITDAHGVLPASDGVPLARALRDVDRDRVARGEPALTDLAGLTSWALDLEAERDRIVPGGTFALDLPDTVPALWGDGDEVLWSEGEPLWVVGPVGIGKSTLALRLLLARVGVGPRDLLGWPVVPDDRPVLYVAADRPRQVARNVARMVTDQDRALLDDRVKVWTGGLDFALDTHPDRLASLALDLGVGSVFVDSLKDVVAGSLVDGEVGSRVNRALQNVVDADVQVMVQHHQTKHGKDGRAPKELADVYGSTFLTAGAGSVVLVWGRPGDPVARLHHLKAPMAQVGPLDVELTPDGQVVVREGRDLLGLLATAGRLSVKDAARLLYETEDPRDADISKTRRALDRLVTKGLAHKKDGQRGGKHGSTPATYTAVTSLLPPDDDGT